MPIAASLRLHPKLSPQQWPCRTSHAGTCRFLQLRRNGEVLGANRAHPLRVSWGSLRRVKTEAVPAGATSVDDKVEAVKELVKDIDFDVGLAIALAGCAFEAYNDPTGVSPDLREIAVNGTAVTYISQPFLEKTVKGSLQVQLKGAKGLAARDAWGTSDPYAVVSVGPSTHTSKVVDRSLDPQWDESFVLLVRNPEKDQLRIKVNDKDLIGSDDGIGYAIIPLAGLKPEELVELDVALEGNDAKGSVQLSLRYSPLTEKFADDSSGELSKIPNPQALSKMAAAWRSLAVVSGMNNAFDPLCFIDNPDTETQAWIGVDREGGGIVVAYRGTEQVKWQDFLTDLNVVPTSFNIERAPEARGGLGSLFFRQARPPGDGGQAADPEFAGRAGQGGPLASVLGLLGGKASAEAPPQPLPDAAPQAWVHSGFVTAYDSVKARITALVDELVAENPGVDWTIYVTGHSLGGALATLSAYDFATRTPRGGKKPQVVMYNYGAPRVGNKVFAAAYDLAVPNSWRVVNTKDVIPRVPRLMGYSHVGRCIVLKEDGSLDIDAADEVFDEGSVIEDVVPDLANEVIAVTTELVSAAKAGAEAATDSGNSRLQRLLSHEMDFVNTFIDGSALMQHFEDFYLAFFQKILGQPIEDADLLPDSSTDAVVAETGKDAGQ